MTYYKEEMLQNALGNICLIVFDDCSCEVGYFLKIGNLLDQLSVHIHIHKSSKYCILPLNPKKGKVFFGLKNIQYVVYYNNRYIIPHNKKEEKNYWKEGIEVNCLGQICNGCMSFDKFKMLVEEAYKE